MGTLGQGLHYPRPDWTYRGLMYLHGLGCRWHHNCFTCPDSDCHHWMDSRDKVGKDGKKQNKGKSSNLGVVSG